MKKPFKKQKQTFDLIYGAHACAAALNNPKRTCLDLYALKSNPPLTLIALAEEKGVPVSYRTEDEFTQLIPLDAVHQGVALRATPFQYGDFEAFLTTFPQTGCVLALDQITDPQNLGAIIRSAVAFSVTGLVLTKHQSSPITATVAKAASGALELLPIFQVTNLVQALEKMKNTGFWCYGLAEQGEKLGTSLFPEKTVLVIGAEGKGLRPLTRERCDQVISIPTADTFTTLNASNAAAVSLYAWFKQWHP